MPGISVHVVDVSRGVVAAGMKIDLYNAEGRVIVSGVADSKGLLEFPAAVPAGSYQAVFHVASWYREHGVKLPDVPFLDVVHYRFGIADARQHYHLPFKCTPWGYSCFRGGA